MDDISYLDLHGDRVAYRDSGDSSGPETLLLIHGMAGSSTTWRDVMPRLAKNYRVIAPDLLGHGLSDKPRGDYSLGAFAVWLRDFLDELNIPRVTVIGQSLGGGIAMQFAYQHRERCDRVVLIGSGGLGPDLSWMLRLLSVPGAELLLPALAPKPVLSAGNAIRGWLSSAGLRSPRGAEMWSAVSSLSDADSRTAFLRTLRSVVDTRGQSVSALNKLHLSAQFPVLLVWGDQDRIIPVSHGYAAHEALPGSRLEIIAGAGHFPHVEAPVEVADILEDFIATTERRGQLITRC